MHAGHLNLMVWLGCIDIKF